VHIVLDEFIEDLFGHPLSAGAYFGGPVFVETVFAIEVAIRAGWFYQ
jgi:hypothetical protein